MIFTLKNIQKLNREKNQIYLGVTTLGMIRNMGLNCINPSKINNDLVIVNYDEMRVSSAENFRVTNPILVAALPIGNDQDEFPIVFIQKGSYLPVFIEEQLLSLLSFNRLVEKGNKLSKNSTKLLTIQSLRDILKRTFSINIHSNNWSKLSEDLITYINILMDKHPYLAYLPILERRAFREKNTADVSFAWEIYFRFFVEQWTENCTTVLIPDMVTEFEYKGWTGHFFARDNPLWIPLLGKNGKFSFNETQRELIYTVWKQWIKGA